MYSQVGSLINRWSMIQKCTNKFCAHLAQVESLHPSGATEQNKIEKAKILYKEMEQGNFTLDYSWNLLRHQPKWHQHMNTLNTRRKPHNKRHSNKQSSEVLGDVVEKNVERPTGKNAERKN
ncbi:glutathione S-transferase T3-like [Carya illinoinensis]|uniref:glutathione S-transferase T3-like n=1 Tax=Carya illinoinensis TaxID=32201 RepID=UPI001C727680|nr:glutathione S-transferase T3-like [Carya illinoinensis]